MTPLNSSNLFLAIFGLTPPVFTSMSELIPQVRIFNLRLSSHYSSQSSGDGYSDRQLTPNFELGVVCQHIYRRHFRQSVVNIAFHPFLFTHYITYSDIFSYNSYTDIHIIYLVFVLFYSLFVYFMCIYDSIHVLIVYVLFRAISLFIESLYCLSEVIKCCAFVFTPHLKALTHSGLTCYALCCLPYGESKTSLRLAVVPTVSIPRYGCPHPFFVLFLFLFVLSTYGVLCISIACDITIQCLFLPLAYYLSLAYVSHVYRCLYCWPLSICVFDPFLNN